MLKILKTYRTLALVWLGIVILSSIGAFVIQNSTKNSISDQWARSLNTCIDTVPSMVQNNDQLCVELKMALGNYSVGDNRLAMIAFYQNGTQFGMGGQLFMSTLDECMVTNYDKSFDKNGKQKNGVDGYFNTKGIKSCYNNIIKNNYGVYKSIRIGETEYYVVYATNDALHFSTAVFVPVSELIVVTKTIVFVSVLVHMFTLIGLVIIQVSHRKTIKALGEERDEAIQTMKDKDVRMDMLSYLMNEFTFEYDIKHDSLSFAEKYQTIFQRGKYFVRFLETLNTHYNIYHMDHQNIRKCFEDIMSGRDAGTCLFRLQMPNGNYEWFNSVYKVMLANDGSPMYVVGKIMNVHKSQMEKEMLLTKSTRDPLTNLLNRSELEKRTKSYIGEMDSQDMGAILIMDLDHFKQVNDTFGHSRGDELLIEVAGIIHDNFRTNDIVGRLGGDEFYIFMKDIISEADAMNKCESLRKTLERSVTYGDTSVDISTSMGIYFVKAGDVFLDIYMKADSALYRAKENGRNQICVHREGDAINSKE